MEDKIDEIRCPHCGKEITGMDRIIIEATMSNKEMIDWTSPCPNCDKTIYKKEVDSAQSQDQREQ